MNAAAQTVNKGTWTQVSAIYTVPPHSTAHDSESELDTTTLSVFIETPYASNPSPTTDMFNFYVDDVSIEVVSEPRA
jgi:hypothetical protein